MYSCAPMPPIIPTSRLDPVPLEAGAVEDPVVGLDMELVGARRAPPRSRSNEYESFMMNSRVRSTPARGRGSSRSLVWKW